MPTKVVRKLFRGKIRASIRSTRKKIIALLAYDAKELTRAAAEGRPGIFVSGGEAGATAMVLVTEILLSRLNATTEFTLP